MLARKERPQVFLFSGPAGCGKTSTARILASTIGADDIHELNLADARGIDTAREMIESTKFVAYSPVVYILDEVHQTSKDFQNAMLKLLEDTPPNVYFVLCSSEPGKIIPAVKSRCTEIRFPLLSDDDILLLCRRVTKSEAKKVPLTVLEQVVTLAKGSARIAIVLLETVLEAETEDEALDILGGSVIDSLSIDLCRVLMNKAASWKEVATVIATMNTTDWEAARYAVLGYMTSVLLKGSNKRAAVVMEQFSEPFYNSGKAGITLACYKTLEFSK
jgi:DNA polymerase-3 subunit gamma/tau